MRARRISFCSDRYFPLPQLIASLVTQATARDKSIVVASTMSTQDAGLFGYLLPIF